MNVSFLAALHQVSVPHPHNDTRRAAVFRKSSPCLACPGVGADDPAACVVRRGESPTRVEVRRAGAVEVSRASSHHGGGRRRRRPEEDGGQVPARGGRCDEDHSGHDKTHGGGDDKGATTAPLTIIPHRNSVDMYVR